MISGKYERIAELYDYNRERQQPTGPNNSRGSCDDSVTDSKPVSSFFIINFKYSALSSPLHRMIRVQLFLHAKVMKRHHSIPITECGTQPEKLTFYRFDCRFLIWAVIIFVTLNTVTAVGKNLIFFKLKIPEFFSEEFDNYDYFLKTRTKN